MECYDIIILQKPFILSHEIRFFVSQHLRRYSRSRSDEQLLKEFLHPRQAYDHTIKLVKRFLSAF